MGKARMEDGMGIEVPNIKRAKIDLVSGSLKRTFEWEYAIPVTVETVKEDARKIEVPFA